LFGRPGYVCSAEFGLDSSNRAFIQCGENGSFAGEQKCALGTVCVAKNFTENNPCDVANDSICGDGIVDINEECDGGIGCNVTTCKCLPNFQQANPNQAYCECMLYFFPVIGLINSIYSVNISAICDNQTGYFCPADFGVTRHCLSVVLEPIRLFLNVHLILSVVETELSL
jgi:hypothetical protein